MQAAVLDEMSCNLGRPVVHQCNALCMCAQGFSVQSKVWFFTLPEALRELQDIRLPIGVAFFMRSFGMFGT